MEVPKDWRQERAYEGSGLCAAASGADSDCRFVGEVTVEDVRFRDSGDSKTYYVDVTRANPPVRAEVEFEDDEPVVEKLEPGDRVRATQWRGEIVELSAAGSSQRAWEHPASQVDSDLFLGPVALAGGAVCAAAGAATLRNPRRQVLRVRGRWAAWFAYGWLMAGVVVGSLSLAGIVGVPRWAPTGWAAGVLVMMLLGALRRARG